MFAKARVAARLESRLLRQPQEKVSDIGATVTGDLPAAGRVQTCIGECAPGVRVALGERRVLPKIHANPDLMLVEGMREGVARRCARVLADAGSAQTQADVAERQIGHDVVKPQ